MNQSNDDAGSLQSQLAYLLQSAWRMHKHVFNSPLYSVLIGLFVIAPAQESSAANAKVGGISINGLSNEQARQRLERGLSNRLDYRLKVSDGRRFMWRRRRDLGVYLAVGSMLQRAQRGEKYVPVLFETKASELQRALRRMAPRFSSQSASARVAEYRGRVMVVPHRNGRTVDVGASTQNILRQLAKNPAARVLMLNINEKPPVMTAQRLKGINARLGSFTTRFNPGKVKRTQNMRLGIAEINGRLLSHNEVFSLNGTVGERTQQRGYRTSIIFKNGYKVPGIGAGISQVTGTLFNAALMAGLPIITYRTHSQPVAYLPLGRDATVAWGGFDMKFKNNTGAPIYIAYRMRGNRATATIYGAQKARPDKVAVRVASQRIGPREIKAKLYRWIRRGNQVRKQQVGTSHYKWNVGAWEE